MNELTVYETHLLTPLSTPYALHQWLWTQVAGDGESRPRDFLYRAIEHDNQWLIHVRMASPGPAELSLAQKVYDIRPGTRYRFELAAVPVRRSGRKTVEILRNASAIPWLEQRAGPGGFRVLAVDAAHSKPLVFHGRNGRRITLNDTLFEGTLEIQDPTAFATSMTQGIGRHKGFGFGLLTLHGA